MKKFMEELTTMRSCEMMPQKSVHTPMLLQLCFVSSMYFCIVKTCEKEVGSNSNQAPGVKSHHMYLVKVEGDPRDV